MVPTSEASWWIRTESDADALGLAQIGDAGMVRAGLWQAMDGLMVRAYARGGSVRPDPAWQGLRLVQDLAGPAAGQVAPFHYVVETDLTPENADALNNWYDHEHLPGLAAVPGTIRAMRFIRLDGTPRSYGCYDLTSFDVLQSEPWLAVRHTEWSSRVRPLFCNPLRTKFRRLGA